MKEQSTDIPGDKTSVAEQLYVACTNFITHLLLACRGNSEETCYISLKECHSLLYLWGEGLSNGNLDRALSHSDDLQESVLELLISIGALLCYRLSKASDFSRLLDPCWRDIDSSINELQSLLLKASFSKDGGEKFNDFIFQESYSNKESENSLQEISHNLLSYVECLMCLLPSFEKTLNRFEVKTIRSMKPLSTDIEKIAVSSGAQQYARNILEKFPQADKRLIKRLGEASFQRNMRLQDKTKDLPGCASGGPNTKCQSSPLSQDDSIREMTSMSLLVASAASFASNLNESEDGSLRVPNMPRELRIGKSFTCTLCKRVLNNVGNKRSWINHIYDDIKPYVCTFVVCKEESITYSNRKLWATHQRTQHFTTTTWSCDECNDEFEDYSALEYHFQEVHHFGSHTPQLKQMLETCKRQELKQAKDQVCPLCLEVPGSSWKVFEKHLGRHLESIALAVLSLDDDFDSDTESSISHDAEGKKTEGSAGGQAIRNPVNSGAKVETDEIGKFNPFMKEAETKTAFLMAHFKAQSDAFEKEREELRSKRALEKDKPEAETSTALLMAHFKAQADAFEKEREELRSKRALEEARAKSDKETAEKMTLFRAEAALQSKAEVDVRKLVEMQAKAQEFVMLRAKAEAEVWERVEAEVKAKAMAEVAKTEADRKAAEDLAKFKAEVESNAREKAEAGKKAIKTEEGEEEEEAKSDADVATAAEEAAKIKADDDARTLVEMQAKIDAHQKSLDELHVIETDKKKIIHFKDALSRNFSFPFETCATWIGMELLIRQAFDHIDILGPLVATRQYDLVGPNDQIILPNLWEATIVPNLFVYMRMWPRPPTILQRRSPATPRRQGSASTQRQQGPTSVP